MELENLLCLGGVEWYLGQELIQIGMQSILLLTQKLCSSSLMQQQKLDMLSVGTYDVSTTMTLAPKLNLHLQPYVRDLQTCGFSDCHLLHS